jgi:hypothetical protein
VDDTRLEKHTESPIKEAKTTSNKPKKKRMWCVEAEEKTRSLGHSVVVLATGPTNAIGKAFEKYPEIFRRSIGGNVFVVEHVYLDWVEGRSFVIEKACWKANRQPPKQRDALN